MKRLMIILVLGGVALFLFVAYANRPRPVAAPTFCYPVDANTVMELTNAERTKAGLAPLTYNPMLATAAANKAHDMVVSHYWAHVSPTGVTPWYWMSQAEYPYKYAGENLAEAMPSPVTIVDAWMRSPGHRANILNPHYTETAVAVTCGVTDKNTTLIVSEYGSQ